jgi:hypothetical protein
LVGQETNQRALVSLSEEITQTSDGFLVLQSTTCWRTNIEPESRWARGAVFWADSEAKVQSAPSGMMKKRKDGFSMFSLLSGLCSALVIVGVTAKFFRVMLRIVSIVSWALTISQNRRPLLCRQVIRKILN